MAIGWQDFVFCQTNLEAVSQLLGLRYHIFEQD